MMRAADVRIDLSQQLPVSVMVTLPAGPVEARKLAVQLLLVAKAAEDSARYTAVVHSLARLLGMTPEECHATFG